MSFSSPPLQGIVQLSTKHLASASCGVFNKTNSTLASSSNAANLGLSLSTTLATWNDQRWNREFNELERFQRSSPIFSKLTKIEANEDYNADSNRYYNVLPYDQTRVHVEGGSGEEIYEIYINANHVEVKKANRNYILTQGPLFNTRQSTIDEFWMMVDQQKTSTIVMLCRCEESDGSNRLIQKSAQYWPQEVGDTLVLGEVTGGLKVKMTCSSEGTSSDIVRRSFLLHNPVTGEERKVEHFHYISWPDFDVPESPRVFLDFLFEMRESKVFSPECGPPVVHCSAGIGRSGTLALVDSCLQLAEQEPELHWETVRELLTTLRSHRAGCVQTPSQLRFSVEAIVLGLERLGFSPKGGPGPAQGSGLKRASWDLDGGEGEGSQGQARKRKKSIPS